MAGEDFKQLTLKEQLHMRVGALKQERSSFVDHWKELQQFVSPRRGRFLVDDRNKGDRRHQSIINSTATRSLRIATAGLLAGIMSPARPWFSLSTPDPDMMEYQPVKLWLHRCEIVMRAIFAQSNLYRASPQMLKETLLFATGAMTHVDDFEDVARFYTLTIGSYMIAQNDRQVVDTLGREFQMTTEQLVGQFGLDNVSASVREAYQRGDYYTWHNVTHCIYPNTEARGSSPFSRDAAYRSVYYEPGQEKAAILGMKGFRRFPAYVPRWDTTGEDVWGTECPGMIALGDTKGLQIQEKRKAQAVDLMVRPVMTGPASLKNQPFSQLPGGLVVYDDGGGSNQFRPAWQVQPQLGDMREDMKSVEQRIEDAFYVGLFLAISNMEGIQPRNEFELIQRNQERLLQLGPVLEHMHGEFLSPLIDRTFEQIMDANIMPPPPPELAGQNLKVDYVSTLAQAQRAVATQGMDRLAAVITGLAATPGLESVVDKLDADQLVDEYAQVIGTPPRIVRPDDAVEEMRAARQQAQQAMDAMGMMQAGAETGKTMAEAEAVGQK